MRKTIAGFIAGVLVATVAGVAAQNNGPHSYFSTQRIVNAGESTQRDYAAGASDTLSFVLWFMVNSKEPFESDFKKLRETEVCLDFRGKSAGALRAFAASVWADNTDQTSAAARLMVAACK